MRSRAASERAPFWWPGVGVEEAGGAGCGRGELPEGVKVGEARAPVHAWGRRAGSAAPFLAGFDCLAVVAIEEKARKKRKN